MSAHPQAKEAKKARQQKVGVLFGHSRLFACAIAPAKLRRAVATHPNEAATSTIKEDLDL